MRRRMHPAFAMAGAAARSLGQEGTATSLATRAVFSLMFIGVGVALGYALGYQKCVQDTGVIRRAPRGDE